LGVDGDRAGVSISKAICVTAFVFLVGRAGGADAHEAWADDPEMRLWLGARAVDVIDGAERVEIARVEPKRLETPGAKDGPPNVGGFPLVGGFKPLEASFLEGFQHTLLERKTYSFPPPRSAIIPLCGGFQPGVALRFWRKGKPVEVLLCFNCSELATVSGAGAGSLTKVLFEPGRFELLRLVGAALPDPAELSTALAAEQVDRARELMFDSMFPPDVLLAFERVGSGRAEATEAAVAQLRQHVSGKALFVLASRALGVKGNDLHSLDGATRALYAAVRPLAPGETTAGLEAIRGDRVALAGAAELLARSGVARELPEPTRAVWVPILLEAFLARNANGKCALILMAANRVGKPLVPLLVRILRGQVALASWMSRSFRPDEPSDAACALMALAGTDPDAAHVGLATWRPATPLDMLAVRAARVRLGDDGALDGALFATRSPTVVAVTLDGVVAHPSRRWLDVLAATGLDAATGAGADGERVFEALTGAKRPTPGDYEAGVAELRAWWAAHREAWQPRAAAGEGAAP
jgi:hypothetical protein